MKSTTQLFGGTMAGVLTLAGVLLAGLGQSASAQSEQSSGKSTAGNQSIEGTWRVTVTQKVCVTGAPMGMPFHSLLTFSRGGTMMGTTSNPAFMPGQRSTEFGAWRQTRAQVYSAVDEAFIIFGAGLFTQGSQVLRHAIRLTDNGNGFTDDASIQFYDVNGNPLLPTPGCASAVGQRLQ